MKLKKGLSTVQLLTLGLLVSLSPRSRMVLEMSGRRTRTRCRPYLEWR